MMRKCEMRCVKSTRCGETYDADTDRRMSVVELERAAVVRSTENVEEEERVGREQDDLK